MKGLWARIFMSFFGGSYIRMALYAAAVIAVLSVWAWHKVQVSNAYDAGHKKATEACALATEQAKVEILSRYATAQSFVANSLAIDNETLQRSVQSIIDALPPRVVVYRSAASAKPLAPECRVDPDRLRAINEGRRRP